VTSVTGTYGTLSGSPLNFVSGDGELWGGVTFGPFFGLDQSFDQVIGITITARDAAGNTATSSVNVRVRGVSCLG
jgi:hypothetical protein